LKGPDLGGNNTNTQQLKQQIYTLYKFTTLFNEMAKNRFTRSYRM